MISKVTAGKVGFWICTILLFVAVILHFVFLPLKNIDSTNKWFEGIFSSAGLLAGVFGCIAGIAFTIGYSSAPTDSEALVVSAIKTKRFKKQRPKTSGLRKRVPEFQQQHYTENFIQCVLDGGLDVEKKDVVLVVGGDGRFLCSQAVNMIIKIAAANRIRKLIVAKDGILSTAALSQLIRSKNNNAEDKIHGGIFVTTSPNPDGPKNDFGIKFNCENGGPAPDSVTTKIFELTKTIKEYRICHELNVDFGQVGTNTFVIKEGGTFTVEVVDGIDSYVEFMEEIFDFTQITRFLTGEFTNGKPFKVLADAMHGVTGPYVSTILKKLKRLDSSCLRTEPTLAFGGGHPDLNLTYAKALVDDLARGEYDFGVAFAGVGDRNMILGKNGFFVTPSDSLAVIGANLECIPYFRKNGAHGFARSMPTAGAIDWVAKARGLPCYEVPTGWKYFGNLMDAGKLSLCGEESFGTGSDHIREADGIWTFLAWLQILAEKRSSVVELIKNHWKTFGRNVFTRYDYEDVDASGANLMMTYLESQIPSYPKQAYSTGSKTYRVLKAENFEYVDPIDGSVAKNQGIRIFFDGDGRVVFCLSGAGLAGATIRIYVEKYVNINDPQLEAPAQEILRPLVLIAHQIGDIKKFTGRTEPTVIT